MNAGSLRSAIGERLRTLPDRHGGRWVLASLCAIVALGLGLRVYYAVEKVPGVEDDSIRYYFIAQSLYLNHSFDSTQVRDPESYHPGAPLFHAAIFFLTGGVNPKASRIAAALLSGLMIVFTYLLGRRLAWATEAGRERGPPRTATLAGLLAALLIAVNPSSIDFYRSMMNEPLASITIVAAVLACLWAAGPIPAPSSDARGIGPDAQGIGPAWRWGVPGSLIGVTVMFRPEAIVFGLAFAALALFRVTRARGRRAGLGAAGALLAAMALALAPWTIRNAITLDRVTPITDGGGNALFIGTYLPGDGDHFKTYDLRGRLMDQYGVPAAERAWLPNPPLLSDVLALVAKRAHPGLSVDAALSKLGREQLKRDVEHHTAEYAGVLVQKFWNMWGKAAAAKPRQGGPGAFGDWFHRSLALLALIGLVLLAVRRRWESWVLGAVLLLATLVAVLTLAPPRRNVDLLPLVSALAAYAVATASPGFQRVRGRIADSMTRPR